MATILKLLKIRDIPIFHMTGKLYFIGVYKLNLDIKGDFLVVQVGKDKFERFADYIKNNRDKFKNKITLISLKNDSLTLKEVV